jgi:hypothetical protein
MRCLTCGGVIIHEPAYGSNPARDYCYSCGREAKRVEPKEGNREEAMSYRLGPKKEEEVKVLLRTASVREIVAKTGVAKATIRRIRDENFTEEERAKLNRQATLRGRDKRELKNRERREQLQNAIKDIPKIIRSTDSGGKGGQEIMTEEMQVCTNTKCPKPNPQPIGEFNKNAARPSGHESRCRTCTAQAQRDRKEAMEKASASGTGRSGKVPGNGRRKGKPGNPGPGPHPGLPPIQTEEAIYLERSILLAIEKKVAMKLLKKFERMIEEAYA